MIDPIHLPPGLIVSACDIGGLCPSLVLSYLGSRGHKTRWVASGTLTVGFACLMLLLPHLIFGPGQDALELTVEYGASYGTTVGNTSFMNGKICILVYFVRN
jgi:hypothetical protein